MVVFSVFATKRNHHFRINAFAFEAFEVRADVEREPIDSGFSFSDKTAATAIGVGCALADVYP